MGMIHRPIVTSYMFHLWQHSCHCLHSSNQLPKIPYNVNWSITSEAEIIFRSQSQKSGQLLEVYLLRMFLWWQSDHNAKPASCCCSEKLKLNFTKFCHSVTPVIRTQYLWPPIACINFFRHFCINPFFHNYHPHVHIRFMPLGRKYYAFSQWRHKQSRFQFISKHVTRMNIKFSHRKYKHSVEYHNKGYHSSTALSGSRQSKSITIFVLFFSNALQHVQTSAD